MMRINKETQRFLGSVVLMLFLFVGYEFRKSAQSDTGRYLLDKARVVYCGPTAGAHSSYKTLINFRWQDPSGKIQSGAGAILGQGNCDRYPNGSEIQIRRDSQAPANDQEWPAILESEWIRLHQE